MQSCPSQITRGEISNYRQQIEDFAKRFYREGPGSVGDDLDKGKNIPFALTRYLNTFCLRILWDDGMEQWFLTLPVPWAHLRIPKAHGCLAPRPEQSDSVVLEGGPDAKMFKAPLGIPVRSPG